MYAHLLQNRGAERALGVQETVDDVVVVLACEEQTLPVEPVRLPGAQKLFGLAFELGGLLLAVGDEEGWGRVGDVEDGAIPEDLIPTQLELRLQEGVGKGRQVVEAAYRRWRSL